MDECEIVRLRQQIRDALEKLHYALTELTGMALHNTFIEYVQLMLDTECQLAEHIGKEEARHAVYETYVEIIGKSNEEE